MLIRFLLIAIAAYVVCLLVLSDWELRRSRISADPERREDELHRAINIQALKAGAVIGAIVALCLHLWRA